MRAPLSRRRLSAFMANVMCAMDVDPTAVVNSVKSDHDDAPVGIIMLNDHFSAEYVVSEQSIGDGIIIAQTKG